MKTFLLIFLATGLVAPLLLAKNLSHREKRLSAKPTFKVDKIVVSTNFVDATLFNHVKPEKPLRNDIRLEKTLRADKIGREPVLKKAPPSKQRKDAHFREWP